MEISINKNITKDEMIKFMFDLIPMDHEEILSWEIKKIFNDNDSILYKFSIDRNIIKLDSISAIGNHLIHKLYRN